MNETTHGGGRLSMARLTLFWLALLLVGPALAKLPPLVPRSVLFGNPRRAAPRLSPDGKLLSYLAPDRHNVLQVWVRTVGKDDGRQVTADKKGGVRIHQWTYAPNTLIYLQDEDGDENYHIHAVDVTTGKTRDLTPFRGVRARPLGTHPDHPDELLVGMNRRDPRLFDVYRVSLKDGNAKLDTENPGDVAGWVIDAEFRPRIAQVMTRDGGTELRLREGGAWKKLVKWGPDDADGCVVGFTKANRAVWLLTSEGRNTLALVKYDLGGGGQKLVAGDPAADASGVIIHPGTREVRAVAFEREKEEWRALDKEFGADLAALGKGAEGVPAVLGSDRDFKTLVVACSSDVKPVTYYLYHREEKKLRRLFSASPALAKYTLAPMKPVRVRARDGLDMVCYLTLPVGVKPRKLPMVLLVHGGPWARDRWGFHREAQWLANRGYAVLQVNYRGSAGFGKKFLHAGDREWAGKMHTDLVDAVKWAVKEGYADPKRVAIMGGSYGGYAALVGATFTPETFRCAVSLVGPSNLVTLLKSIPPYWAPVRQLFAARVGPLEDEEFLKSRSPLFKVGRIKGPLLIAQGANDRRVKKEESEQIVAACRKAGKDVTYLLFEGEGHGLRRPENRMKYYEAVEKFLARHLGGRYESAGK